MSNENDQNDQNQRNRQQPSNRAANEPWGSEYLTMRRPRPGSIVLIAPAGTRELSASTEDFLKIVLSLDMGE